jgi:hypothetical protein
MKTRVVLNVFWQVLWDEQKWLCMYQLLVLQQREVRLREVEQVPHLMRTRGGVPHQLPWGVGVVQVQHII